MDDTFPDSRSTPVQNYPLSWTINRFNQQYTALGSGAHDHVINIFKLLLENKADPNVVCKVYGRTPLQRIITGPDGFELKQIRISEGVSQEKKIHSVFYDKIADLLLANGADINVKWSDGYTLLHLACMGSRISAAKWVLDKGADVNAKTDKGRTPLDIAVEDKSAALITLLVDHGAKMNNAARKVLIGELKSKCKYGYGDAKDLSHMLNKYPKLTDQSGQPVANVLLSGFDGSEKVEIVEVLLEHGAKLNQAARKVLIKEIVRAYNEDDKKQLIALFKKYPKLKDVANTPIADGLLFKATQQEKIERVKLLLKHNTDIDIKNSQGQTLLLQASGLGYQKIVELLLTKGADINLSDKEGLAPLYAATAMGKITIVKLLLAKGADPQIARNDGETPLLRAALIDNTELVKLLLDRGASPRSYFLKNGWTPLHYAALNLNQKVATLLIQKDADVNARSSAAAMGLDKGITPLHVAAMKGNRELIKTLIENGATVESSEENGFTPLYIAAWKGNTTAMGYLIEKGARVDVVAKWMKATPLYRAARSGHLEAVKLLIQSGAKVNQPITAGQLPLHGAVKGGQKAIVELLLDNGAEVNAQTTAKTKSYASGTTPLHIAASKGYKEIVVLLLKKGADSRIKDEAHARASDSAQKGKHYNLAHFLVRDENKRRVKSK